MNNDGHLLSAFLEWLNTLGLEQDVQALHDLSDGLVFLEVLRDVDRDFFGSSLVLDRENTDNWVLRFHNLKRVYKLMLRYYTDVLGRILPDNIDINLAALAKRTSVADLQTFSKLVLATAVQSERREVYVNKIRTLDQQTQAALKAAIEQIIEPHTMVQPDNTDGYRMEEELAKIFGDIENVAKERDSLSHRLDELQQKYNDLQAGQHSLLERLEKQVETQGRSEVTLLQASVVELEERLNVKELQIEDLQVVVSKLNKQVSELKPRAERLVFVQQELQDALAISRKVQLLENTVEKYRQKLEDTNDLRQRFMKFKEENEELIEKNHELENSLLRLRLQQSVSHSHIDDSNEQRLEVENKKLHHDLIALENQYSQLKTECDHDAQQIQLLEDRIREFETERPPDLENLVQSSSQKQAVEQTAESSVQSSISSDGHEVLEEAMKLLSAIGIDTATNNKELIPQVLQKLETVQLLSTKQVRRYEQKEQELQKELESNKAALSELWNRFQLHTITVKRAYEDPSSWLARQRKALNI